MHYVISDIHGCLNEFLRLLDRIKFGGGDTLYVLGDVVDRGYAPVRLVRELMAMPNAIPVLGNHDLLAYRVLKKLSAEVTEESIASLTAEDMGMYADWTADGGDTTAAEFSRLSREEQADVLEYFEEFSLYEQAEVGGKSFVLVHGGLDNFDPARPLDDYGPDEMLFSRPDYDRVYYPDRYLVTGHTPTPALPGNGGTVIKRNNHIAVDCGCVFGYNLAAYCMETDEEAYVPFKGEQQR